MKSLSQDIRDRVIAAKELGESSVEVAKKLSITTRTVDRIYKRYRETGQSTAMPRGGKLVPRLRDHTDTLRAWIEKEPGLSLEQLCERCREELGIALTVPGLWFHLKRNGLRFKKNDARKRTAAP